jgi:hypothetical protein
MPDDRPAHDDSAENCDIEITPEMIEAGLRVFFRYDSKFDDEEETIASIYRGMEIVRRNSLK